MPSRSTISVPPFDTMVPTAKPWSAKVPPPLTIVALALPTPAKFNRSILAPERMVVEITNPWTLRSALAVAVVRLAVPPSFTLSWPPLTVVALARPPKKTCNSLKVFTVVEIATPPLTNKLPKSTIVVCSVVPPE